MGDRLAPMLQCEAFRHPRRNLTFGPQPKQPIDMGGVRARITRGIGLTTQADQVEIFSTVEVAVPLRDVPTAPTATVLYDGIRLPDGEPYFHGFPPGAEATGPTSASEGVRVPPVSTTVWSGRPAR